MGSTGTPWLPKELTKGEPDNAPPGDCAMFVCSPSGTKLSWAEGIGIDRDPRRRCEGLRSLLNATSREPEG
jgi:hypothetical protein